jgi:hybrid cluster-associated redox disulfide protein
MAKSKLNQKRIQLDPDILIMELTELHPEVIDFLISEYEFHCIGCIMAGFETLRQGAQAHGIIGKDYEEMLSRLEGLINKPLGH